MTEWKRFNGRPRCGSCGDLIASGAAVRVVSGGVGDSGRRWTLVRCEACSRLDGLYPPRDLAPAPRPVTIPSSTRDPLTPIGAIARSGRDRQVGEDDE